MKSDPNIDYKEFSELLEKRYSIRDYSGVTNKLRSLVRSYGNAKILEVGCGTGHWLSAISSLSSHTYGMDISNEMLNLAQASGHFNLIQGRDKHLPFQKQVYNFIFCINAFHFFDQHRQFLREARRSLKKNGTLAIFGMNPHHEKNHLIIHEYFPETHHIDMMRYPNRDTIIDWMTKEGFLFSRYELAEIITEKYFGTEILNSHFLKKSSCSQLAQLPIKKYKEGKERLRVAVSEAEVNGQTLCLEDKIIMEVIIGQVK